MHKGKCTVGFLDFWDYFAKRAVLFVALKSWQISLPGRPKKCHDVTIFPFGELEYH